MVEATDPNSIRDKRKAISALFPYAVYLARNRQQQMVETFLRALGASNSNHREFVWSRIGPYITPLFGGPTPPFLNSYIMLASPCIPWRSELVDEYAVTRWAAATSAVSYTEEICQSVVSALLQIASTDSLRPYIPIDVWMWLEKRPSLPPKCPGRSVGTAGGVVRHIRALGDVGILKSYLLLAWSEWNWVYDLSFTEMGVSIREDFGGVGMRCHREDLIERLDQILGQLDRGLEFLQQHKPSIIKIDIRIAKEQYTELKRVLLEVDGEAMSTLTRTPQRLILFNLLTIHTESHSTFACALPLPCP